MVVLNGPLEMNIEQILTVSVYSIRGKVHLRRDTGVPCLKARTDVYSSGLPASTSNVLERICRSHIQYSGEC
jgi:hypothetical protein